MEAEAQARTQHHEDLLSECQSLDKLYKMFLDQCHLQPSETPDKLTTMLADACNNMAETNSLFSFHVVGVGSHHDGTKVSGHGDMDYMFVFKYRAGEMSEEGARDSFK